MSRATDRSPTPAATLAISHPSPRSPQLWLALGGVFALALGSSLAVGSSLALLGADPTSPASASQSLLPSAPAPIPGVPSFAALVAHPSAPLPPLVPVSSADVSPARPPAAAAGSRLIGVIPPKGSLGRSLAAAGVASGQVHAITQQLASVFDPRRARVGDAFVLRLDAKGALREFEYTTVRNERYRISRDGERYAVRSNDGLVRRTGRLAGVIATGLNDAIEQLGEQDQLARDFADIFAYDVDFARGIRRGDEFSILYERLFRTDKNGKERYLRPGRIYAASYRGASGTHTAVYFEAEPGRGGYYRPDGSPMQRSFLVAPLRYTKVTSGYSLSRFHPILRYSRPHEGIDYAAPEGTPLWSVGDGKVVFAGRQGGFGNLIKVEHAGLFVSYYSHLSRFAPGLTVGQFVRQKQIVGFVGSTGLATGPHVCFRMQKDGKYVNPLQLNGRGFATASVGHAPGFKQQRDVLISDLRAQRLVAVEAAL
jgi:murein DD-endopeptidase MepM/ murein hydrolase activator NlpD